MKRIKLTFTIFLMFIMSACNINQVVDNETIIEENNTESTYDLNVAIKNAKCVTEYLDTVTVDDFETVILGKYEQDGDESNGKEDIEWLVLDSNSDGELFLISRYILDIQPFNKERGAITWENSSIRKWLNDNFYNSAFTDEDKAKIKLSYVLNDTGAIDKSNADQGNGTFDNLYLLSNEEISKYHDYVCKRIPYGTEYAKSVGRNSIYDNAYWINPDEFYEPDYDNEGNPILDDMLIGRVYFWLRSPAYFQHMVSICGYTDDDIFNSETACDFESGIRPAMWVKYK